MVALILCDQPYRISALKGALHLLHSGKLRLLQQKFPGRTLDMEAHKFLELKAPCSINCACPPDIGRRKRWPAQKRLAPLPSSCCWRQTRRHAALVSSTNGETRCALQDLMRMLLGN